MKLKTNKFFILWQFAKYREWVFVKSGYDWKELNSIAISYEGIFKIEECHENVRNKDKSNRSTV